MKPLNAKAVANCGAEYVLCERLSGSPKAERMAAPGKAPFLSFAKLGL
jgi:hypothetical protein